jgi:predicted transposase YdaD
MTTENNKLIAEFMGAKLYVKQYNIVIYKFPNKARKELKSFKYHSDWNWLMEVVEKIESLKPFQLMDRNWIGFDVKIYKTFNTQTHYCTIKYLKEQGDMTISNGFSKQSKIEAVYNACVEFIKWYNENKI